MIDGYTQESCSSNPTPCSHPNTLSLNAGDDAAIKIVLDGSSVTVNARGLDLESGSDNSTIRGFVISHWNQAGIWIQNGGGNTISGNFIGTDVTGLLGQGGGGNGIEIAQGSGNTIGGELPALRNVISGYSGSGIDLSGATVQFTTIEGNYIGTNKDATGSLGNTKGISIQAGASNNFIGCAVLDGDNVISGNNNFALSIVNGGGNFVTGNFIGVNANASPVAIPNGRGIIIIDSPGNSIGGVGTGNVIANNSGFGIKVSGSTATGNLITANSIFGNVGLGIDLLGAGEDVSTNIVTPNDPGDGDTGPNNLQNFPVITAATAGGTNTISGTLNTTPNSASGYVIEFFKNTACDGSGNGEGKTYLGAATTGNTDANGDVSFMFTGGVFSAGDIITSTATDVNGNTSEFSACFTATTAPTPSFTIDDVTHNEGDAGTTSFTFTITKTGAGAASVDYATVDGTATAPSDYTAIPTTTLNFLSADTSKQVTVLVNGDTLFEGNETFTVHLSNAVGATISDADGLGTIINDDPCPTVFTVNNNGDASDANPGDGLCATNGAVCTLRAAIEEANALTSCGTIDINFSITGTITLTGQLVVSHDVNVNGPGANQLTISGNNVSRVFNISSGKTVTISNLTVSGGKVTGANKGGGVLNSGTLTLTNVTLNGNSSDSVGGGIFSGGNLTMTNCVVTGNTGKGGGGGIEQNMIGAVGSVTNSTVSGNNAPNGGGAGIENSGGTFTITNVTVSGNSSFNFGGGIYNGDTLLLVNSTVSGNVSKDDGGGLEDDFTATIVNSTITNNHADNDDSAGGTGGGIKLGGNPITLHNTIVAGNFRGTGSTRDDINGAVDATSMFNLIGDGTNMNGISNGTNGNHVGSSGLPIDPLLGALMDNGGPTFTHGLLYNSPAVDAGDDCVFTNTCSPSLSSALTLDQRGLSRQANGDLVAGAHVDIGAYERQASESRLVPHPGSNVNIDLNDARVSFPSTTTARGDDSSAANGIAPSFANPTVSISVIDPSTQPAPPPGYSVGNAFNPPLPAFDVSSTATYTPPVGICFYLPSITDASFFAGLKVLHNEGGVLVDPGSQVSFGAKLVCTHVSSLSPFVIAHTVTPSAANGSIGGTITDSNSAALAGTTINLSGTQNRETITDAEGKYSFDSVETNGFYTVTPSRANYSFNPPNRSFSALGVHTEASFTASANGDHLNAIDTTEFFVRQQYLDFLGREPDPPGFNGWVNTLRNCAPGDASCDRVHVSEAFFRSAEFQERGYFVYRFYSSAFGRKPAFAEFTPDLGRVSGFLTNDQLEAAKAKFVDDFMSRPLFAAQYNGLSNSAYVDALINTAAVNLANRQALVDGLSAGTLTRAQVLRQIAESGEVYQKYYNQAFVVMEYFGYLRRDPDALYLNWIQVLDANPADSRHMVNGFVSSTEYRNRFAQ